MFRFGTHTFSPMYQLPRIAEWSAIFQCKNHRFSGAILHSFCIFSVEDSTKKVGIYIAIRYRSPYRSLSEAVESLRVPGVPTPVNVYVKSEKKRDFSVSSSVIKTVSIREKFKLPAVFVQIQPG